MMRISPPIPAGTGPTANTPAALLPAAFLPAAIALLSLLATGCIDDSYVTLDKNTNKVRARSVVIDAGQCLKKDGAFVDCATANPFDLRRVSEMRGVIGAPKSALALDSDTNTRANFGRLSALYSRVPMGYGCAATLQGIFNKPNPTENQIKDINNYNLTALEALIGAVRNARPVLLWTAGYGLGDGKNTCNYKANTLHQGGKAVGEQQGAPIKDPAKWAKVVRRIAKYYDRDLPAKNKDTTSCKNPQGGIKPWDCSASIYNIEYGRDPDGAGGFTDKTKTTWLEGYKQFASELRKEFPWPENTVHLLGPSVVLKGEISVQNTKPGTKRSWLFDFVDYVVDQKLSINFLSFEVVASSPTEAHAIIESVYNYAAAKKMENDSGVPIQLFLADLRLDTSKLPATIREDPARLSAYEGSFWSATKMLVQGMVVGATVGRAVRFPTEHPGSDTPENIAATALDSNLMWYNNSSIAQGEVKPAAWHAFWFNDGFLGGGGGALDWETDKLKATTDTVAMARAKSMLRVQHGPDALGGNEKKEEGLIVTATRENCVYPANDPKIGEPKDCVEDIDPNTGEKKTRFPAVTEGRKRALRVMVSDGDFEPSGKEVLEHQLRVHVTNLPKDVKTIGYRWARMNGNDLTFGGFVYPEQGVIDVQDGKCAITRSVAVPSLHYFEFLY